jgi:type II pantothenate kinase
MSPSSAQLDPTAGDAGRIEATPPADLASVSDASRPRRTTVQSDIHGTILRPGTVRINVQGAFIVDDEPVTPRSEDYEHDPRDIRLPNHTSVVSHVAVDVSNASHLLSAAMYRSAR